MEYPFAISAVFLFLSVILLAQASITLYNYNSDKKAKDLNYYWSCFVLMMAIVGVISSGVAVAFFRKSAQQVVMAAPVAAAPPVAAAVNAPTA